MANVLQREQGLHFIIFRKQALHKNTTTRQIQKCFCCCKQNLAWQFASIAHLFASELYRTFVLIKISQEQTNYTSLAISFFRREMIFFSKRDM